MKSHQFYSRYANLPISKRYVPLDLIKGNTTMLDLYKRMKENDNNIAQLHETEEKILEEADRFMDKLEEMK